MSRQPNLEHTPLADVAYMEIAVLGCLILEPESFFSDGAADLNAEHFALGSHRIIFQAINDIMFGLVEGITTVDYQTLRLELDRRGALNTVGGPAYLASLTEGIPRNFNIENYCRALKDASRLRTLAGIFHDAQVKAHDIANDAEKIVADVQNKLIEESAGGSTRAVSAGEVTAAVEDHIEKGRFQAAGDERTALGLTWGIQALDKFTKGAHAGEVTVVAAESGGGKTIFATQMVIANAREGTPCAIFSLEMSKEKLLQRMYSQMAHEITADIMRDPRLINEHTHMPAILAVSKEIQRLSVWVDDTVSLNVKTLVARIRMMRRKHGIKLFVIDYLQLIVNDAKTEAESIKGIMFMLRDLVKLEPDVHIVLLSQFSKADGFNKKRRRTRSDLMGSSAIHHAAQNVLIITVEDDEDKHDPDYMLDTEFRFDKQRDGKKGKVVGAFDRRHLTYGNPEPVIPF